VAVRVPLSGVPDVSDLLAVAEHLRLGRRSEHVHDHFVVGGCRLMPARIGGGATPYMLISANTTNGTVVKATPGQVYGIVASNINAAARYLKLYDAAAVSVGTTVPKLVIALPPGGTVVVQVTEGMAFSTGIAFATTTGVATADTGAVAAAEIVVNLAYK
jgi:hypothetical protein